MTRPLLALLLAAPLAASADWKPVEGSMLTRWGAALKPDTAWADYPRPLLQRESWQNLNGLWNYTITAKDAAPPTNWTGNILVPFAPEAPLSGVGRLLEPAEALWYQRPLPAAPNGKRTLLHFEAVDYRTTVWVNGREIGTHTGGNTPFSFDITDALRPTDNTLLVRVHDETGGFQLRGKQVLKNQGIFYTRVSGIWQTVWLEHVAPRHITRLDHACDIKAGTVTLTPRLSPAAAGASVRITARLNGKAVASATASGPVTLTIPTPKLWSPDSPTLYNLTVELLGADGKVDDAFTSYTALREIGRAKDKAGNWRFTLNGKPLFHWGPLDQGWWPDGLLTPPSDEAMRSDLEFLKAAGFNMIRKHIKVEPRRYYTHCDRLGLLVWQDQVSGGPSPKWVHMNPGGTNAVWPDEHHAQWVTEYQRMVDHLHPHPCIAVWTPFNEAWGQHRSEEVGKMAADYDPTRLINIASGGNFFPVGHIADQHAYPHPKFPFEDARFPDFVKVVGEFGGHGWPVEGHLWNKNFKNWGYGGLPKTLDEWKERYTRSLELLMELRTGGVSAGVYTQTTDVEGEINGLLTYDRVPKVDPAWLRALSDRLLATPDTR